MASILFNVFFSFTIFFFLLVLLHCYCCSFIVTRVSHLFMVLNKKKSNLCSCRIFCRGVYRSVVCLKRAAQVAVLPGYFSVIFMQDNCTLLPPAPSLSPSDVLHADVPVLAVSCHEADPRG